MTLHRLTVLLMDDVTMRTTKLLIAADGSVKLPEASAWANPSWAHTALPVALAQDLRVQHAALHLERACWLAQRSG